MEKYIQIKTQFEGAHRWADCPFAEVGFLKAYHRHIFHVTATLSVTESNRQLEFFMVKHRLDEFIYGDFYHNIREKSCEMMAEEIVNFLFGEYGDRYIKVKVSEDGENSGIVVFKGGE